MDDQSTTKISAAEQHSSAWSLLSSWLLAPVPAGSLGIVRVVLGLAFCYWSLHYLISGRAELLCDPRDFHFTWPGFDWVRPWPGGGMQIQFGMMAVAGVFLACGFLTHLSNLVVAFGITHFFFIDRTNYQNHYYLLILISWSSLLLPLYRIWSFDSFLDSTTRLRYIARFNLLIVQFHAALPYVFGGISKFDSDWLSSRPMRFLLVQKFQISPESELAIVGGFVLAWGGLLFDLLIVPCLLWNRTRSAAWLLLLTFHLTNAILFPIHIFPWLMIGLSTVFLPPDWPATIWGLLSGCREQASTETLQVPCGASPCSTRFRLIVVAAACYCLFHLAWPLRPFIYPDPVGWTERGHYFSWRMMLRGKATGVQYFLTNPSTRETWAADISRFLHSEQAARFSMDPEMIRQLAAALAETHFAQTGDRPEVRVLALSSLNGRRPQLLVDPMTNLAAEPPWPQRRPWIMPLTEPLPTVPWRAPVEHWQALIKLPPLPWQNEISRNSSVSQSSIQERNYAHGFGKN